MLYGIFTPPQADAKPTGRCVIFAARPRFAFQRLLVFAARILASAGFAVLRFDLRGSGESEGPTEIENRLLPRGEDLVAAITFLRKSYAQSRFLLVGYCFDGLCALDAVPAEAESIDGVFCAAAPVTAQALRPKPIETLRRGMRSPGSLLSRLKDPRSAAGLLRRGSKMLAAIGDTTPPTIAPHFIRALDALARSQARALFVYGEDDAMRDEFRIAESELIAPMPAEARARIEVEIWPGVVHSTEAEPAIFERALKWALEFNPGASA
jgi:pimeloyl-ACP methyl ester carboxylesterase